MERKFSRPSIYGPWTSPLGIRHERAPSGIVLLRTLGMMPLKDTPAPKDPAMGLRVIKSQPKKG